MARVNIVYRLSLLGLDRQHILDHIAKKYPDWRSRPSTIDTYIAKAKVLIEAAGEYERPIEFGRSLARKHDLYTRCMNDKDYRGALAVQKEIDELLGLKAPQQFEVGEILPVIDAEIRRKRREVEKLERQYALESPSDQGA
jgi:hypothetical protein